MGRVHVIAEMGLSHCCDLQKACQLALAAKNCGADSVKTQIIFAHELFHPNAEKLILPTGEKSLFGTLGAIVFSFVGICLFLLIFPLPLQLWQIIVLAVASGLLELAGKGLDNFTLSFGVMALATLFLA